MSNRIGKWLAVPIADFCEAIVDCVNKTAPTVEGSTPYRMIRTTNVRNGRVDTRAVRYVDSATYQKWSRRGELRVGDIVLTREAPLGEVGLLRDTEGIFLGQRLVMYRADEAVADNRFLAYALQSPWVQAEIRSLGSGATVEHMRVPDCERIRVPAPPLPTQKKIGATLGVIDDLIENNRRRIEILEEMTRLIYREWFVHFRFPGHENVELADSRVGLVPDGWTPTVLADLVIRLTPGQRYKAESVKREGTVPVIDQSRSEVLGFHDDEPGIQASPEDPVIAFGDHTCRIEVMIEPFSVGPNVVPFSSDAIPVLTLAQMVDGLVETREYKRHWSDLQNKIVVRPPDELLDKYAEQLTPCAELSRNLRRQNQVLLRFRDLLLPRLISGEVDVSGLDLNLEPVV